MDTIKDEMRKTVEHIDPAKRERPRVESRPYPPPAVVPEADRPEQYEFVKLGEKFADYLIKAAEEQMEEATKNLAHARVFADQLRTETVAKNAELTDFSARLKAFGGTVFDARRKFQGSATGSLPPSSKTYS